MKCIFIVGLSCAGKSEYGNVAESLGYPLAEWSFFVKKDLLDSIAPRRDAHQSVGKLVAQKGFEYYPRKIFEKLSESGANEHVVSGARNPKELLKFRSFYDASCVVWVSATYRIRYQRNLMRNRGDAELSVEEFLASDFHELKGGLAEIAAEQVDDILFNDESLADFRRRASEHILGFFGEIS